MEKTIYGIIWVTFFGLFCQNVHATHAGIDFINKTGEKISIEYYLSGDEINYKSITLEPGQILKAANNPNGVAPNITRVYRIWYNSNGGKEWSYIGGSINFFAAAATSLVGLVPAAFDTDNTHEKLYEKMCITKDGSGYHALTCYDDYK